MSGFNKAIIAGRLGRDPEIRYTTAGKAVCNFSVATSEVWTDANGEKQEKTEWHNVTCWEKLAEACGNFLAKGRQCIVEGKIQTRKWQDKEGNDRYSTDIIASRVEFLGSKNDQQNQKPSSEPAKSEPAKDRQNGFDNTAGDDDVPF